MIDIVHLDDDAAEADLVRRALTGGPRDHHVRHASDRAQFEAELASRKPDLLVLDMRLPGFDGLTALALARERGMTCPAVFFSSTLDDSTQEAAMRAGAADYIPKPHTDLLVQAVERHLARIATKLKVLLVEDSPEDAELLGYQLKRSGFIAQVERVEDEAAFRAALEGDPDVVIADFRVPGFGALRALQVLREGRRRIPFIVVSGQIGEELAVQLIKQGAADYLLKDRLARLGPALRAALDQKELAEARERADVERSRHEALRLESLALVTGGVSHHFNNLLCVIVGYSQMLLEARTPDDPDFDAIQEITKAAERATEIAGQLSHFARGKPLMSKLLEVNDVLREMGSILRYMMPSTVELTMRPHADPLYVKTDRARFEQALINLVMNARDAMPMGGHVTIETTIEEVGPGRKHEGGEIPAGRYARLRVIDDGCGIPPEARERLFHPFFTTKEPGQGTGLGLPTTYGLVKQSQGHILVDSEVGKGTTFTILLPEAAAPGVAAGTKAPAPVPRRDATVLVAEDEPAVLSLVQKVLKGKGFRLLTATSAGDAFAQAKGYEGRIDLLLTDVMMPGEDGFSLATRLREVRPDIKVLFTSAVAHNETLPRALRGNEGFLPKPFEPRSLLDHVEAVLGKAASSGS